MKRLNTHRRKLTEQEENEVRRHYFALDWSMEDVAKKFQISPTLVLRLTGGVKSGALSIERVYGS